MKTILLSAQESPSYVQLHRIRTRDRLGARLCSFRLDRALADGAPPDSRAALSLHAHRLIGPNARGALARKLRGLAQEATQPRTGLDPRVPLCRRGVFQAASTLDELADRLAGPAPVEACGVAQVRVLLRSGDSPLFDPDGAQEFGVAARVALAALDCYVAV